jgi:transcriptional regulator GlxA family with amidase domain
MSRHQVAVLALPSVVAFELGLPDKFIGGATGADGRPLYQVRTCTLDGGPVRTSAGYQVLPEHGPEILADADTVVLPGIQAGPALAQGRLEPALAEVIGRLTGRVRLVSICTSAFVLAAAGLLDGRPATTHWVHADRFRALFPKVRLNPDVLYVDNGDVLTSAGNAAGIDLCLHLVRRDHGAETAARTARRGVVAPYRDGGQSQFIEHPLPVATDTGTGPTREWAVGRLREPLTLAELAGHARMSVRTFTRRFRAETGQSPTQWLTQQRVRLAMAMLESTDLAVERVAVESGLGTPTSLRQHLHAVTGVAPLAYRRTFRGNGHGASASVAGAASRTGRGRRAG